MKNLFNEAYNEIKFGKKKKKGMTEGWEQRKEEKESSLSCTKPDT